MFRMQNADKRACSLTGSVDKGLNGRRSLNVVLRISSVALLLATAQFVAPLSRADVLGDLLNTFTSTVHSLADHNQLNSLAADPQKVAKGLSPTELISLQSMNHLGNVEAHLVDPNTGLASQITGAVLHPQTGTAAQITGALLHPETGVAALMVDPRTGIPARILDPTTGVAAQMLDPTAGLAAQLLDPANGVAAQVLGDGLNTITDLYDALTLHGPPVAAPPYNAEDYRASIMGNHSREATPDEKKDFHDSAFDVTNQGAIGDMRNLITRSLHPQLVPQSHFAETRDWACVDMPLSLIGVGLQDHYFCIGDTHYEDIVRLINILVVIYASFIALRIVILG